MPGRTGPEPTRHQRAVVLKMWFAYYAGFAAFALMCAE